MAHRFLLTHRQPIGLCPFSLVSPDPFSLRKLHSSPSRLLCQPLNSLPSFPPRTRRRTDPGDWRFSPEWWGTQGRGWGHNEGITVFRHQSDKGNGLVAVTAHPASNSGVEDWPEIERMLKERHATYGCRLLEVLGSEWRVLRFNNETRQSVAKVLLVQERDDEEAFLLQIPNCLAFEYLKSMVSVGLTSLSCAGLDLELVAHGKKQMRALCVGLGGGSLPLFLVSRMQGCFVEVVEIDRTVISAATDFMGFPGCGFGTALQSCENSINWTATTSHGRSYSQREVGTPVDPQLRTLGTKGTRALLWSGIQERISGFEADGASYVYKLLQQTKNTRMSSPFYDLVLVDAYDGNDVVPHRFWSKEGPFLTALRQLLHPNHGTVVVNLHTDMPPPSLLERVMGDFGPGFDPRLPGGRQVQEISRIYRDILLQFPSADNVGVYSSQILGSSQAMGHTGVAFTMAVPHQQNISLVISRGIDGESISIMDRLKEKACFIEGILNIPFDMSKRISRGFTMVK